MKIKMDKFNQRGFSVIIAIILMTLTVSTVIAITSLFLREFKLNADLKYSTQAFFAAESGIESLLWQYRRKGLGNEGTCSCDIYCSFINSTLSCLGNGATYTVEYNFSDASPFYILSTGDFKGIKRAIRTSF